MDLKLEPSDYAKVAVGASAICFVICAILSFVWWNDHGFDTNTTIAIACAVVCAVILVISAWLLARGLRAERMEDVEIIQKFVPGDGKVPDEPEKPTTEYKMPKQ